MLKRLIGFAAASLLLSSAASAAPEYDAPAWKTYIEDGKGAIPDGAPTGRGAIAAACGEQKAGRFSADYYFIDRPINMSSSPAISLPQSAADDARTYAPQNIKDFLEATAANLKKLTGKSLPLPVRSLWPDNPKDYNLPYRINHLAVVFGVYGKKGNDAVPLPAARLRSDAAIADYPAHPAYVNSHEAFQTKMDAEKTSWIGLNEKDRQIYAGNVLKRIGEQRRTELKAAKRLNKDNNAQYDDKKYLEEMKNILSLPEDEQTEALDALHEKYGMKSKTKTQSGKNKTAARRERIADLKKYAFDADAMWFLFEAMITQNAAEIAEIKVPEAVYENVLNAAKRLKRSSSVIDAFTKLAATSKNGDVTVTLGCAARDRFLGCPETSPAADAAVTKLSRKMIGDAAGKDGDEKLRIFGMISLAQASGLADAAQTYAKDNSKEIRALAQRIAGEDDRRGRKAYQRRQAADRAQRRNALFERVKNASQNEAETICKEGIKSEYDICIADPGYRTEKTGADAGRQEACIAEAKAQSENCDSSPMPDVCRDLYEMRIEECAASPADKSGKSAKQNRLKAESCSKLSNKLYESCMSRAGSNPGAKKTKKK